MTPSVKGSTACGPLSRLSHDHPYWPESRLRPAATPLTRSNEGSPWGGVAVSLVKQRLDLDVIDMFPWNHEQLDSTQDGEAQAAKPGGRRAAGCVDNAHQGRAHGAGEATGRHGKAIDAAQHGGRGGSVLEQNQGTGDHEYTKKALQNEREVDVKKERQKQIDKGSGLVTQSAAEASNPSAREHLMAHPVCTMW